VIDRCLAIAIALALLASGCSEQSDLKVARERIAQLEAELAAVKGAPALPPVSSATTGVVAAGKPVEPEVKTDPLGQQWNYEAQENKMTGGDTRHATVLSSNTVNFGSPYAGEQHGRLTLRVDPKYGRDVIFSIERGQLLCRSYEDCNILVRFDEGKPENFSGVGPADNSSDTVFIRNYDRFLGKLRRAKIVRISLNVYQEGNPVFEFDVSGFDYARHIAKK